MLGQIYLQILLKYFIFVFPSEKYANEVFFSAYIAFFRVVFKI